MLLSFLEKGRAREERRRPTPVIGNRTSRFGTSRVKIFARTTVCILTSSGKRGVVTGRPRERERIGEIVVRGNIRGAVCPRQYETLLSSTCRESNRPPPVPVSRCISTIPTLARATILEARPMQAADRALSGATASRHDGSVH